jgi:hypothetical protein
MLWQLAAPFVSPGWTGEDVVVMLLSLGALGVISYALARLCPEWVLYAGVNLVVTLQIMHLCIGPEGNMCDRYAVGMQRTARDFVAAMPDVARRVYANWKDNINATGT